MNKNQKSNYNSKAQMLLNLQKKINESKIEPLFILTVEDWGKNSKNIINIIQKKFHGKIIVRSSAKGEDSETESQAGVYDSILNVNSKSILEIKKAISKVSKSYQKGGNFNNKNQILIQKQTTKILYSGVIFSRTTNIGSPYFIINYDEGDHSDTVTHGRSNKTTKIFRKTALKEIPNHWRALIKGVKEIEKILGLDYLDIEFAITKNNQIVIFQVRVITSISKKIECDLDDKIDKKIIVNKNKFLKQIKKKNHSTQKQGIFSDMSDWNPAEIIGNNPNMLDYSLYDFLIMEKNWHEGRRILGYQNVNPYNLMIKFGNKPYVDINGSFNSLIPDNIPKKLKNKLMKFYVKKLIENPQLLDKVEFEILFTCYDMMINKRLKELKDNRFSDKEIKLINKCLIEFTNKIIEEFPKIVEACNKSIKKMQENRKNTLTKLNKNQIKYKDYLFASEKLLNDCREFGTLPFSTIARIAFISSIILRSLEKNKIIDLKFHENLMNSIKTPVTELQEDLQLLYNNKITNQFFNEKYGHLRPGTYDITAIRYDQANPFFDNLQYLSKKKNILKFKEQEIEFDNKLLKPLIFNNTNFINFVKTSLSLREKLKFEFTKNLSDSIELIENALNEFGFTREDISNLEIKEIFTSYKKYNKKELLIRWNRRIIQQKRIKMGNNYLVLPPLICSQKDFDIMNFNESKPNFISTKSISGKIVKLNNKSEFSNIQGKIVLIENADPGYDWIFTKNPIGLITKYGGVASHMAIRCSEIGLPAAIGCGEIFYEKLGYAKKIMLDCKNEHIVILENEKEDKYLEEEKMLKSLGYIK